MNEVVESEGQTLNQDRERKEDDDDEKIWIYMCGKLRRQTRLWNGGWNDAKIFFFYVGVNPSYRAGVRGRHLSYRKTSFQRCQSVLTDRRTHNCLATPGTPQRMATRTEGPWQMCISPLCTLFHHRLSFPYCEHYFSLLVIQLFFREKFNPFWQLPVTQSFVSNHFECFASYVTAWLFDSFIANFKLEKLRLCLSDRASSW